MKPIKKTLTMVLAVLLVVLCLTACGKKESQPTPTSGIITEGDTQLAPVAETPTETQAPETTAAPTTTVAPTTTATPATTAMPTTTAAPATTSAPTATTTEPPVPTISYPLTSTDNGFTLTLNADGSFTHVGTYEMDLSAVGISNPLPIDITTTGNYIVSGDNVSLSNTKMIMNCSGNTLSQLSGLVKVAASAIKNIPLTDKSSASISGGQLTFTFVGSNGSNDYSLSHHTFSVDDTAGILAQS